MDVGKLFRDARHGEYVIRVDSQPRTITPEGKENIRGYVCGCVGYSGGSPVWSNDYWRGLWRDVGTELVSKDGKIAKRIARHLYKTAQVSLTSAEVSQIGNYSNAAQAISGEYIVSFVADMSSLWSPGKYGDYGSCYFDDRRNAPPSIFEHGGAAITVQESRTLTPVGRAWVAQPDNAPGIALWNWYSRYSAAWNLSALCYLLTFGDGSPFSGADYGRYDVVNDGCTDGTVWINTTGALIHAPDDDFPDSEDEIELGIYVVDYYFDECECESCGRYMHEDQAMYFDGYAYCESCYPAISCAHCGNEYHEDNMVRAYNSGEMYCDDCYHELYTDCDQCHNETPTEDIVTVTRLIIVGWSTRREQRIDYNYCDRCAGMYLVSCDDCAAMMHEDDANTMQRGDRRVCDTCAENYNCERCADDIAEYRTQAHLHVCAHCYADDLSLVDVAPQEYQLSLVEVA